MLDEAFHKMAVAQQRFHMAYSDALIVQLTARNGSQIKDAWKVVEDKEFLYHVAFDEYIKLLVGQNTEAK